MGPLKLLTTSGDIVGFATYLRAIELTDQFNLRAEEAFTWVQEVLVEAKKTFDTSELQLLPKTPSAKRARKQLRKVVEESDEETEDSKQTKSRGRSARGKHVKEDTADGNVAEVDTGNDSAASSNSTQPRRNARTAKTRSSNARATRNTRSRVVSTGDSSPQPAPGKRLSFVKETKDAIPETIEEENVLDSNNKLSRKSSLDEVIAIGDSAPESEPTPKKTKRTQVRTAVVASPALSSKSSPRSPYVKSPKAIPGFSTLTHVKQKAQIYENFVRQSNSVCETPSDTSCTESRKTPSSKARSSASVIPATPNSSIGESKLVPDSPLEAVVETPEEKSSHKTKDRRSSRTSLRRSIAEKKLARLSGVNKSASKRRSSHYRVLRQSIERTIAACKAEELETEESLVKTKPVEQTASSAEDASASSGAEPSDQPRRTTRSKMRLNKPAPPKLPVTSESDEEDKENQPQEAPRRTRSKMRVAKEPAKLPAPEDEDDMDVVVKSSADDEATPGTPVPPVHTTRSKMRVKPAMPKLPAPSSDEDDTGTEEEPPSAMAPLRSTRSKMRHWQKQATQSPYTNMRNSPRTSVKRAKHPSSGSDTATPPKRICSETSVCSDERRYDLSSNNSILNSSRLTPGGARIAVPVHPKSFLSSVKRNPGPNTSLHTVVHSFINRNTPKKVSAKDKELQKRKEIEAKQKDAEDRIKRKQEEMQRKADEMRRKHLDRQKQVAARREERERMEQQNRRNQHRKLEESKTLTARMMEEKIKEERERQKQREKKAQEAEAKRKQEEELRAEKQREKEREQREHEELMARKREYEEAERQRRLAEQRRVEEERRQEAERERALEAERLRQEEEKRLKQEAEERRLREERERKEKESREKLERERQAERERQRQEELRQQREVEMAKVREAAAQEKQRAEEERRAKEAIRKHNTSIQQNTSSNTSINHQVSKTLNTTITMDKTSDALKSVENKPAYNENSYEITPHKKPVKKRLASYNNYNIEDLNSEDSTDDEEQPRKRIPAWAQGAPLKVAVINQNYHPPNLDEVFRDCFASLDLNIMFKHHRPRFNKRTSSAQWDSPMMKPSGLPFL